MLVKEDLMFLFHPYSLITVTLVWNTGETGDIYINGWQLDSSGLFPQKPTTMGQFRVF